MRVFRRRPRVEASSLGELGGSSLRADGAESGRRESGKKKHPRNAAATQERTPVSEGPSSEPADRNAAKRYRSDGHDEVSEHALPDLPRASVLGAWDGRSTRQVLIDWLVGRRPSLPPPPPVGPIYEPSKGKTGICCSGGGIRSAAFNLGALQVLEENDRNEVSRARYISAVSGGSYTAAALSILRTQTEPGLLALGPDVYQPGSPEEVWLRNHSSYVAPGIGGKLRLVVRVLGGFVINVLFVALTLYVVGEIVGWAYAEWLYPELAGIGEVSLSVD